MQRLSCFQAQTRSAQTLPQQTPPNAPPDNAVFIGHWKLVVGTVPHSEVEISRDSGVSRGDMTHQWPNTLRLALN